MWKKFSNLNGKDGIRLSTVDNHNIVLDPKNKKDDDVEQLEEFDVGMVEGFVSWFGKM